MNWVYSVGEVPCALEVEPRISAKSNDNSTSAPPSTFRIDCSHPLHRCGVNMDGRIPSGRVISVPTPPRGVLHCRQRGSPGNRLYIACSTVIIHLILFGIPSSPTKYQYQISSANCLDSFGIDFDSQINSVYL